MVTKARYRSKTQNRLGRWPWSALGIEKTTDKAAIHAAYAQKRAALDSETMRISAFAELTEAREKALFLASELRRDIERKGLIVGTEKAVVDTLPLQNKPEPENAYEHGGGYRPGYEASLEEDDKLLGLDPDLDEEWSHAGGYIREAERTTLAAGEMPDDWGKEAAGIKQFLERYPPEKYAGYYIAAAFLFIAFCSG